MQVKSKKYIYSFIFLIITSFISKQEGEKNKKTYIKKMSKSKLLLSFEKQEMFNKNLTSNY